MILWDNRCTMHARTPTDHTRTRVLHRAPIKGGPIVAACKEDTASDWRAKPRAEANRKK